MPVIANNYAPKDQSQHGCGKPQAPQYWINIEFTTELAPRNKRERELVILHEAYRERTITEASLSLWSIKNQVSKQKQPWLSSHGGRQSAINLVPAGVSLAVHPYLYVGGKWRSIGTPSRPKGRQFRYSNNETHNLTVAAANLQGPPWFCWGCERLKIHPVL